MESPPFLSTFINSSMASRTKNEDFLVPCVITGGYWGVPAPQTGLMPPTFHVATTYWLGRWPFLRHSAACFFQGLADTIHGILLLLAAPTMADSWLRHVETLGRGVGSTFRPAVMMWCVKLNKQVITAVPSHLKVLNGVPESRNMLSLVPETGVGEVKPPSIIIIIIIILDSLIGGDRKNKGTAKKQKHIGRYGSKLLTHHHSFPIFSPRKTSSLTSGLVSPLVPHGTPICTPQAPRQVPLPVAWPSSSSSPSRPCRPGCYTVGSCWLHGELWMCIGQTRKDTDLWNGDIMKLVPLLGCISKPPAFHRANDGGKRDGKRAR